MLRLFECYLVVDWSARSTPSASHPERDAIWVGEALAPGLEDDTLIAEHYWPTRRACEAFVRARLVHHVQLHRRVFVGFDFAYGYPAGFARALGFTHEIPPWRRLWDEVSRLLHDDERNRNNRFEVAAHLNQRCGPLPGPFWGCPRHAHWSDLNPTSPPQGYPYDVTPDLALERLRRVDRQAKGVQPGWKLMGQGSVGGQSLVGIPVVSRLRDDPLLQAISRVWPFETGFHAHPTPPAGPWIIHGEIWPGLLRNRLDPTLPIRDQAQVRALVQWLKNLDTQGHLGACFAPVDLPPEGSQICKEEEGWILGVGRAEKTDQATPY